MKTCIIALNSHYIHTPLAAWYLKASCDEAYGNQTCGDQTCGDQTCGDQTCGNQTCGDQTCGDQTRGDQTRGGRANRPDSPDDYSPDQVRIIESNINIDTDQILKELYRQKPDAAAFSCYVWNVGHVAGLASDLKKALPDTRIIFGGPEVSFDTVDFMERHPYVDYILSGEGEENLPRLLQAIRSGEEAGFADGELNGLSGLTFRKGNEAVIDRQCPYPLVSRLDSLPSPYDDQTLDACKGRIVYFEASRGCPFKCSYCLSSVTGGVRYFSPERVKQELRRLSDRGAHLVKFVDRTFNCNPGRAKDLFGHIVTESKAGRLGSTYHFEMAPDLFDAEMLDILSEAPSGLIQFETGIQTLNKGTLQAVSRRMDKDKAFSSIRTLVSVGNIHMHADLIAGLPGEDLRSFGAGFDEVYGLTPHHLQLGFLKRLKGSRMASEPGLYGYEFCDRPPYAVLRNDTLDPGEVMLLKDIADFVDRYHNSGRFRKTTAFILKQAYHSPFAFFLHLREFAAAYGNAGGDRSSDALPGPGPVGSGCPKSTIEQYQLLYSFFSHITGGNAELLSIASDLIRFDFLSTDRSGHLPFFIRHDGSEEYKARCMGYLRNDKVCSLILPYFDGASAKEVIKKVHFEDFDHDPVDEGLGPDSKPSLPPAAYIFIYTCKNPVTSSYPAFRIDNDSI